MSSQYLEYCIFDCGSGISSNMRTVDPLMTDNFRRIPLKHSAYIVSETQIRCVWKFWKSCFSYSQQNCLNDLLRKVFLGSFPNYVRTFLGQL